MEWINIRDSGEVCSLAFQQEQAIFCLLIVVIGYVTLGRIPVDILPSFKTPAVQVLKIKARVLSRRAPRAGNDARKNASRQDENQLRFRHNLFRRVDRQLYLTPFVGLDRPHLP